MSRNAATNITVKKRLIFLFFCTVLLVAALIGRLVWLQIVVAGELGVRAWDQWTSADPVRAPRGEILDRNGRLLAGSAQSVSILAYPRQIADKEEAARLLAPVLEMEEERVLELLNRESNSVFLKRKLDEEGALEVRELGIRGVRFSLEPKRYYPHGSLASQLLGFVGTDAGLSGLEYRYEKKLKGRDGRAEFQTDGRGRQIPQGIQKFVPPADGYDLVLTMDQNIQFILEQEMERTMMELLPKGINAIALDPRTGEVLAISGKPDFDPNNFQQYPDETWKLPPVSNTFEPGSTFKMVTLAAAIEEGKFRGDEGFFCTGAFRVAGRTIGCWTRRRGGHGAIDFTQVVLGSCNPGFITLQQRIGADTLMDYVRLFGFGERTGIDVIGEGSGILFSPQQYGPVEAATTSFGQGVSVTPIQQVMAVAAMANGGYLMRPYVVKEIRDSESNVVRRNKPHVVRRIISDETVAEIIRIMELVVVEGSGRNAAVEGYRIAGKTGTAQKVRDGRYVDNEFILSFIGFAPAEDPQILVFVAVDTPQVGPQWGSTVSAPLAGRMLERMLKYMNIPPSTTQVKEVPSLVEVPDVIGMNLTDAAQFLEPSGLVVRFVGGGSGKILNQTPKPGARVPLHTQLLLYLEGEVTEGEVTVPDLTGKPMREAVEILGWLGLRMNGTGSGVVVGQNPQPGTKVAADSVVNVEFAAPGEAER